MATGFVSFPAPMPQQDKVRGKPEKFADHYTQATLFFESQTPVEQAHIAAAFRFELSKLTVPAIRERMLAGLVNASPTLAAKVAAGLGMKVPAALPKALATPVEPEVRLSPPLSLMARPGDGSIRTRKVALLVADGIDGEAVAAIQASLLEAGAIGRLVGPRIGPFTTASGETMEADASMENEPGFLFDGLVLPDGEAGVELLATDGHTAEFIKDQYRHCKTILALGASRMLLAESKVSETLLDGGPDAGVIVGDVGDSDNAIQMFIAALGKHRHPQRETDPPRV